jgi:hypothetical protein
MGTQPDVPTGAQRARTRRTGTDTDVNYRLFTDEQLIVERRRLRDKLDELTVNPRNPPVTSQMLANMEQEMERMTDELGQRAQSLHPSSGMSLMRRFRSMSWPTHSD